MSPSRISVPMGMISAFMVAALPGGGMRDGWVALLKGYHGRGCGASLGVGRSWRLTLQSTASFGEAEPDAGIAWRSGSGARVGMARWLVGEGARAVRRRLPGRRRRVDAGG